MQQLCDELVLAERTTKAEAQLKEKYQMRFKVLGERLKTSNGNSRIASEGRTISNGSSRRQSLGGAENFSKSSSNGYLSKRTSNSQYGLLKSNSASTFYIYIYIYRRKKKISSRYSSMVGFQRHCYHHDQVDLPGPSSFLLLPITVC